MKYAPKWPLKGVDDIFEMYESPKDLVKYHLKSLLLTSPGEKISDSNYGIGLRSFLFEQASDAFASNLEERFLRKLQNIYLRLTSKG